MNTLTADRMPISQRKGNSQALDKIECPRLNDSYKWYLDHFHEAGRSDERLIHFAVEASDPFEFPAKYILYDRITERERIRGLNKVPVTLDASASAYQIMSVFLLDKKIGKQTSYLPIISKIYTRIF